MTHCLHFGTCGGCAVDDRHAIDKSAHPGRALWPAPASRTPPIAPLVEMPLHTRRRVDLAATRKAGVNLARPAPSPLGRRWWTCRNASCCCPDILRLLPPLRVLLRSLRSVAHAAGSVVINWLDHGPDILLRMDADFTGPDRTKIIAFARAQKCAAHQHRHGHRPPEPAIILAPPVITFAGVPVEPPPGAFPAAKRGRGGAPSSPPCSPACQNSPPNPASSNSTQAPARSLSRWPSTPASRPMRATPPPWPRRIKPSARNNLAGPHEHHPPRPPPPPATTRRHGRSPPPWSWTRPSTAPPPRCVSVIASGVKRGSST